MIVFAAKSMAIRWWRVLLAMCAEAEGQRSHREQVPVSTGVRMSTMLREWYLCSLVFCSYHILSAVSCHAQKIDSKWSYYPHCRNWLVGCGRQWSICVQLVFWQSTKSDHHTRSGGFAEEGTDQGASFFQISLFSSRLPRFCFVGVCHLKHFKSVMGLCVRIACSTYRVVLDCF